MFGFLKSGACAVALSVFALAPVIVAVTADVAFAKSENGKDGGGNKDNDKGNGKNEGKGNGGSKGGSGNSGNGKSASSPGASGKSSGLGLDNLFKKNKPDTTGSHKTVVARTKTKDAMHPSNLGKMNGAINSSPNAKLAHIRNGNFNGPVGLAAALAVEDRNYTLALEAYDKAGDLLALAEAYDLLANAPTTEEIAAAWDSIDLAAALDARALLDNGIDDGDADLAAQAIVDAYGPTDGLTYPTDLAEANDIVNYPDLSEATALTEGTEAPLAEDVEAARALVDAGEPSADGVTGAEVALLEAWNKSDITDPTDPAAVELLARIRESLPAPEEIDAALATDEPVVESLEASLTDPEVIPPVVTE